MQFFTISDGGVIFLHGATHHMATLLQNMNKWYNIILHKILIQEHLGWILNSSNYPLPHLGSLETFLKETTNN